MIQPSVLELLGLLVRLAYHELAQECGVLSLGDDLSREQLPILSEQETTHWIPIVMPGAGKNRGWFFIPEPEDEVEINARSDDDHFSNSSPYTTSYGTTTVRPCVSDHSVTRIPSATNVNRRRISPLR